MESTTPLVFAPDPALHVQILRAIAEEVSDLPMVLKGGTALLLCYGLDRFSEDLDFDGSRKFDMTSQITRAVARLTDMHTIHLAKNTATVQRYKVHYWKQGIERFLKIETSFRQAPDENRVTVRAGIRTYVIRTLIEQKVAALLNRTRARDLYDVAFLARTYREDFSPQVVAALREAVSDLNAMEARFRPDFQHDLLFSVEQLTEHLIQLHEAILGDPS